MEAQGHGMQKNIVFQENKSAILMEKNGKASSSKRTKHINIRFYFITDRTSKGEASVTWCPTGDVIGDFMTKPTQGALFRKFRDQIMGVAPAQDPWPRKTSKGGTTWKETKLVVPQECVGTNDRRAVGTKTSTCANAYEDKLPTQTPKPPIHQKHSLL